MSHRKLVSISVVAFVAVACALVSTVWFVTKSNGSNYDNEEFFSTFKNLLRDHFKEEDDVTDDIDKVDGEQIRFLMFDH